MPDMKVEQRHHAVWDQAMAEWADGPRTMKATADWANRWVHRLRTEGERMEIALANAEQRGRIEGMERAAVIADDGGYYCCCAAAIRSAAEAKEVP